MSDEKFEIAEYQNKAASMVIANQSDRIDALAIVAEAKRRAKVIADSFEVNVKTAHAAWKAAVAHRDGFLKPLADLETTIKQKVIAYDREQERLRQEEQRRLQSIADEQARKERDRLLKQAERLKTEEKKEERLAMAEAVVAPVIEIPKAAAVSGVSTRKTWDVEIVNVNDIPREYMVADIKAITAFVRATKGKNQVAGCKIIEREIMAVRA